MKKGQKNTEPKAPLTKEQKAACLMPQILKIAGSKWTLKIIHSLSKDKKRFGELMKELDGVSPRTLSSRLSALEKCKVVKKKTFPVVPPHTEYSLTEGGKNLMRIFHSLNEWQIKFAGKDKTFA